MTVIELERPRAGTTTGFVVALAAVAAMMAGASAPSPFYPVLQARIGFSAGTMTIIFAVYAVALLLTLLVAGSLSDHIGRRPVISAGLMIPAASMIIFWQAGNVEALIGARIVQGIGAGLLLASLTAAVVDNEPPGRPGSAAVLNTVVPIAGLAVGALLAGVVLDPAGRVAFATVFVTGAVTCAALGLLIWRAPETSPRVEGLLGSLRPKVGVPAPARTAFVRALPALIATRATGGLYLSLGASLVTRELGGTSHVSQGLVVTALAVGGSTACFVARTGPGGGRPSTARRRWPAAWP
ncbi:MFS transporter [Nocardioides sp. B-3]|uniref:MFS transporter n=1 Tax=Nocardioides sp. B-3 TaxID=2895565 RepID=UPI0021521877|nr:MFS transporter [Nocardioides sp. B-3]UUZ58237.1 MFS transporter [Nocardioides sp. B-3]